MSASWKRIARSSVVEIQRRTETEPRKWKTNTLLDHSKRFVMELSEKALRNSATVVVIHQGRDVFSIVFR
uniref:DUF5678 domain-containing protein n=1 Tax=Steinernema glaseri TaxID=37863 RepID=A0A1I7ZHT8_9BILA